MRNYIILNGQNSQSIQGLLIQSLAPISKPLMRTQIEEIDGRNGDIVEDLGFSAYDKQITVGLYGEYDVDEVIAYFNSKGTVVFSNEPEKYYNYEIIDQIDFERLVRYKTATVTMHCQPFKYSTVEGAETLSPSDNLLSIPDFTKTTNGLTVTAKDGIITLQGTGSAATEFYVPTGGLNLPAGSYTLTATASGRGANAASLRLIKSAPSNADSFGGKYVTLKNAPVTISSTISAATTYNYLWFYINPNTELNFKLTVEVEDDSTKTASGEGSALVLEGTTEMQFSKLEVKGNASQQTYSGKNLLPSINTTRTRNGVTFTHNDDGSITLSGTASADTAYPINVNSTGNSRNVPLSAGNYILSNRIGDDIFMQAYYGIAGGADKYTTSTFTLEADGTMGAYIYVKSGANTSGKTIYPMVEKGSTATDYEQYVGGVPSPNPDYPQDIKVLSGDSTVKITGKNILNVPDGTTSRNGTTMTVNGGVIKLEGTLTAESVAYAIDDPLRNTNYASYISWGKTTLRAGTYTIGFFKVNGSTSAQGVSGDYLRTLVVSRPVGGTGRFTTTEAFIPMETDEAGSATFTLSEDKEVCIVIYLYGQGNTVDMAFNIQLEAGSSASDYTPHISQNYVIPFGDTYLAGIGDYADEPVKVGDTWYIRRAIGKVVLDGSGHWAQVASGTFYTDDISDYSRSDNKPLSNNFTSTTNVPSAGLVVDGTIAFGASNLGTLNRFYVRNTTIGWTSETVFKQWLSAHPTTVYYVLATPTNEEITDQDLIDALETMYEQAHAYKGRTHITATADDDKAPAIIESEVQRSSDGNITNNGNIVSKPTLTIYGSGNIGVSLNGYQILEITLGDEEYITIDTAAMEAYKDTPDNLKNRLVTGDYENFALQVGENQITFSGNVTKCIVENYSRWL